MELTEKMINRSFPTEKLQRMAHLWSSLKTSLDKRQAEWNNRR